MSRTIFFMAAIALTAGVITIFSQETHDMSGKPYHHNPEGGYRNLPGSPQRANDRSGFFKFIYNQMTSVEDPPVPEGHVMTRSEARAQMAATENPSVTWLGHAAFFIRMGGKIILTDPYLGQRAGPAFFGPKRFVPSAMSAEELPKADVMLISHNHYDHLDAVTISAYPHKGTTQVIVPLGLGKFFTKRGYKHVLEQDWWQKWSSDGLAITTLPAVHFSGRGMFDRNKTLWASYAIAAEDQRIWFSGDTAKGPVFDEIGKRAGPFDLALIGIGAYEPRKFMKAAHTNPEEAIEVARAVKARKSIGMHWGTIMLTPENPFESPVRFRKAAKDQGYGEDNAIILKIGETWAMAE